MAQNGLRDIPSTKVEDQKAGFVLPEGAEINLYAAEPMLTKPVHMNWDSQGRLWVVSSPLYPHIAPGQGEIDQVVVLEDTDGDGAADKSTVFAENLHIPTAVLPGDGGAYVANSTDMIFLKDTDGDGKSDHREVVLSGFGTEDTHHLLHTFRWGPEGMIWMNQSIYIHTHMETPYGIRRLLGGGMWHYHPESHRAEVYMKGLVNPWGHAFDEYGQSFLTDGAGREGINYGYPRSVYVSSPGAPRIVKGLNPGQPKHCGLEVLSGGHIPEEYRGHLLAPDFRGHRINRFQLSDNGSTAYASDQQADLVSNTHRAFRPIDVKMGPDGAIYVADWYNPIIQHGEVDFRDERRDHEHGRIWRISFPGRPLDEKPDFSKMSETELAAMAGPVGWNAQMASHELRQRDASSAIAGVRQALSAAESDLDRLHLVQASLAVGQPLADEAAALATASESADVRAGALRCLYYHAADYPQSQAVAAQAVADPHPRVRQWAVSVLAQLPYADTVQLALRALEGLEQPADDYLDFAVWSICREHQHKWLTPVSLGENPFDSPAQLLYAMRAAKTSEGSDLVLDAFAKGGFDAPADLAAIADWVARSGDRSALTQLYQKAQDSALPAAQRSTLLAALANAAQLRKLRPEGDLSAVAGFLKSEDAGTFQQAALLSGLWQIAAAREPLQQAFVKGQGGRSVAALDGLRALGGDAAGQFLSQLASDAGQPAGQRARAITAYVKMAPAPAARLAAKVLPAFEQTPQASAGIFSAFLSNKAATTHLTNALKAATLPESVALVGLQKASSAATKPDALLAAIQKAGSIQPMKMALSPEEMQAMMQAVAERGDPHRGEAVYRKASLQCQVCHAIGDVGGIIGPDLVSIGASAPVDYLIESMLEPSKKIKEGYHTTLITMKNGDTHAGAIASEDKSEIVIRDAAGNETRLAKSQVKTNQISPVSLMPPGLTMQLRQDEFVDLIRFLSELGKEGDFKTTPVPYLRKWQVLQPHERTRDAIGHYGERIFAEDFPSYQWTPFLASVDGSLPLAEMPKVVGRGRNYGVARTMVTLPESGELKLKIDGKSNDLHVFLGEEKVEVPQDAQTVEVVLKAKPGEHRLTVCGVQGHGLQRMRVELLD